MVYKAVVVDKDYGSVSYEELQRVKEAYAAAGIELELAHYVTEDEIIEGCRGAVAILGTGNPPITRKVMEALPEVKYVQRFGAGVNSIDLDAASELKKIVLNLPETHRHLHLLIPYDKSGLIGEIRQSGKVYTEEYREDGTFLDANVDLKICHRIQDYILLNEE